MKTQKQRLGPILILLGALGVMIGLMSLGVTGPGAIPGIIGFYVGPVLILLGLVLMAEKRQK